MQALGFITTPRGQNSRDAMFMGGTTNPSKRASLTQQARPARRPPTTGAPAAAAAAEAQSSAPRAPAAPAAPAAQAQAQAPAPGRFAPSQGATATRALSGDALLQRRCEYLEAQVRSQAGQVLDHEVLFERQRGHMGWMQARALLATTEWCLVKDGTDSEDEPPPVLGITTGESERAVAVGTLVSLCYPMRECGDVMGAKLLLMKCRKVDSFSGALSISWLVVSRTLGGEPEQRVGEFAFSV
jgi:hypothetical protein